MKTLEEKRLNDTKPALPCKSIPFQTPSERRRKKIRIARRKQINEFSFSSLLS